jgi:hypothetical protein
MKRPANEAKVLERIKKLADDRPDIAIRSTFVVGFPGETEDDFKYLMDWLEEARLDRVGAFRFEPVEGAAANDLPNPVPEEIKEERYARLMELTARISAEKLEAKIGRTLDVIIDAVDEGDGATGRSKADAPEIDGEVHLRDAGHLKPGRYRRRSRSRTPTSTTCSACGRICSRSRSAAFRGSAHAVRQGARSAVKPACRTGCSAIISRIPTICCSKPIRSCATA